MCRQQARVAIFLFVKDQSTDINTFKLIPNGRFFATDIVKGSLLHEHLVV